MQARYNSLHFNLTDAERRRGVWHVGSGLRLRPFADKLISGKKLTFLCHSHLELASPPWDS